jgi:hypothetical protein
VCGCKERDTSRDLLFVAPCSVVMGCQRFRGRCRPLLQGELWTEATLTSGALVSCRGNARRRNPKNLDFNVRYKFCSKSQAVGKDFLIGFKGHPELLSRKPGELVVCSL